MGPGSVVRGGSVASAVAVGRIGVGDGGGAVGLTVGIGIAVAGTGVGVEPEQAATNNTMVDIKSAEARRRLINVEHNLKMLTSFLHATLCGWM